MVKIKSKTKKKLLTVLAAGASISLSQSVGKSKYIFKNLPKNLYKIDRQYLYRLLREFNTERLIDYQEDPAGIITIKLTEDGVKETLKYSFDDLVIPKPAHWDKKWRLVLFDIPEKKRRGRDALRLKLRDLGFYEWQKSAFVYPYECQKEINFVIEVFDLRPYVRYAELSNPTNEVELKIKFNLN